MEESIQRPTKRRPFQFSLRSLFAITTLLAVMLSLLFASPGWVRLFSSLFWGTAYPAVLTTVLVYGKGYLRTFCLGALFPSAWAMFYLGYVFFQFSGALFVVGLGDLDEMGQTVAAFIMVSSGMSVLVGLLAMGTRRLVESPDK